MTMRHSFNNLIAFFEKKDAFSKDELKSIRDSIDNKSQSVVRRTRMLARKEVQLRFAGNENSGVWFLNFP